MQNKLSNALWKALWKKNTSLGPLPLMGDGPLPFMGDGHITPEGQTIWEIRRGDVAKNTFFA